jgi:hypothetical protein
MDEAVLRLTARVVSGYVSNNSLSGDQASRRHRHRLVPVPPYHGAAQGGEIIQGGQQSAADLLSPVSAWLSRSNIGGWAKIRQHKWADIHCHSHESHLVG